MALSLWNDPFGANVFNDPFFSDWTTLPTTTAWPTTATTTRRRRRRTTTSTWSPWSPLTTIGQAMNDPDADVGHWHFDYHLSEPVQLALEEYADKYVARIYHPGVAKEKLKLDVESDTLIVSGEYEPSEMEEKQPSEPITRTQPRRLFRRFVRYMVLPDDADQSQISASHAQEYLEITIKKISGAQQRQARIPIK